MQQLRAALHHPQSDASSPLFKLDQLYNAPSGHDSGSRVEGATSQTTGVPTNIRHRQFMGMEQRPGTIRL